MYFARKLPVSAWGVFFAVVWFLAKGSSSSVAMDAEDGRKLFMKGDYAECIRQGEAFLKDSPWDEDWPPVLAQAQLAVGKYPDALTTIDNALQHSRTALWVHLVAYEVYNANGRTNRAQDMLEQLNQLAGSRGRYVRAPLDLVALGKAALLMNIDPALVLENFFDQAKRIDPKCHEAWLACGDLALDKHDYALASKSFTATLKQFPDDPDAQFGLARSYENSDTSRMGELLSAVLAFNTNHVGSLLMLAEDMVDSEEYDEAGKMLDRVLSVNPWQPDAWAYRAVIAHLRNDTNTEASARQSALKFWSTNPRVDYLIGQKLSQKYRFFEGSRYQRQALAFDPNYLPARIQLAQDLLRLGDEKEGWQLAEEVHKRDGYDVTAYNLNGLRSVIGKFETLTNQDFILRMAPHEAALYGDQALALLEQARDVLSKKYGYTPDQTTTVEIFPDPKDFGVRTFGVPHNPGYLGVCFGHVVTANSPESQTGRHGENWQAVLWHEFCHVITLGITRNKMPRWLSEGISVYEERQANPTWGQAMNPRYREMVLGDGFKPIGELSAAFMSPKTPADVQFAYFESELVVEYLVQTYGLDALKQILVDLGQGVYINEAIANHTAPMEKIEREFLAFARKRARDLAPGLDWTRPADSTDDSEASASTTNLLDVVKRLLEKRGGSNSVVIPPDTNSLVRVVGPNYWELLQEAATALSDKKWAEAKAPAQKLIDLYPSQTGQNSAYAILAAAHRGLNETNEERAVLIRMTALEDDASDAYERLMELDESVADWKGVAENAERFLAVNPLVPQPYRHLARSSEELGNAEPAIRSYRRLLLLDPPDVADVHYRLARLLRQQGNLKEAKRHVLQALEEAPRFRDAQRLLLELEDSDKTTSNDRSRLSPTSIPGGQHS
jgi:tetratricopeptide (TPR) repeat protein